MYEDHFLMHAHLLVAYAHAAHGNWRRWVVDEKLEAFLCQSLGDGLRTFLAAHNNHKKRLVTKTPSVQNLHYFFALFPRAYLLILIRDGRAVVESRMKTFGEPFEVAVRKWAEAAAAIRQFDAATRGTDFRYLIVRYEDIWTEVKGELQKILTFLDLEPDEYDFETAMHLPVRGSSAFGRQEGKVHWRPVEKTADFNPLQRWSHWDRAKHERFNWLAGESLTAFGYHEMKYTPHPHLWTIWNLALDIKWRVGSLLYSFGKALKRSVKRILGPERTSKIRRLLQYQVLRRHS
jgi:protein-tyrosine sulfotransferase